MTYTSPLTCCPLSTPRSFPNPSPPHPPPPFFVATDDGFMVGCAYVLKVLGQTKNFASLHWFDSVTRRYAEQQLKVKAEHDALSRRERKRQRETAKLTLNRLARFATEFETLYFSFDGALIFFRD